MKGLGCICDHKIWACHFDGYLGSKTVCELGTGCDVGVVQWRGRVKMGWDGGEGGVAKQRRGLCLSAPGMYKGQSQSMSKGAPCH